MANILCNYSVIIFQKQESEEKTHFYQFIFKTEISFPLQNMKMFLLKFSHIIFLTFFIRLRGSLKLIQMKSRLV